MEVRYPLEWPDGPVVAPALADGPLRLLYTGRCERRKGVHDLIEALTAFSEPWHLTIIGGDTPTAPLGLSMRRALELLADGDPRIEFRDAVARDELPALMREHDAVVMPSRWECWPYVALEALGAGVPVIGTPVGGLGEMVEPGVTGWRVVGHRAGGAARGAGAARPRSWPRPRPTGR